MRKSLILASAILIGNFGVVAANAQTGTGSTGAPATSATDSGIKSNLALGEVSAINQADKKISLNTKDGAIDVMLSDKTVYKRVSPENPSLYTATAATLADIGVGDRVMVTGAVAADKKSVPAKQIFLMTKGDISKRNQSESDAWRTRGISGRVVSVNPATQEFTVAARGIGGEQNIVVSPKEKVDYRRYAPDSVKFNDAKTSSFSEIKVGDQIRALGDKSADGASFKAERIIAGSFKTIGGTITAIDTAKNEITIKDVQSGKPLTIVVNDSTTLKKFPAEMAQMMALRTGGGTPGAGGQNGNMMRPPQNSNAQAAGGQQPGGAAGQGRGMRGGRGAFDDLLDSFPNISLADLKVGDAIAISSANSADTTRYTAIKLVSGVEPFLKAPQMSGGRRGGGGGADTGFTIPGLDGGISAP